MSKFEKCAICGRFEKMSKHKCPPKYILIDENEEEHIVYGYGENDAATHWAEERDKRGEHEFADGREEIVTVKNDKGGETQFNVSAEVFIEYYAKEI